MMPNLRVSASVVRGPCAGARAAQMHGYSRIRVIGLLCTEQGV